MADTTFRTVLPALKAVDNGDGTYSMGVRLFASGTPVSGMGALGASAWVIASDAPTAIKNFATVLQAAGYPVWVCDGTADNVQIQAAIDALTAGVVLLSVGTFTLAASGNGGGNASSIFLDDYIELKGSGKYATKLVLGDSIQENVIGVISKTGVKISDLEIDANKAGNVETGPTSDGIQNCIYFTGVNNSTVENCYLHNAIFHGIFNVNGDYNTFTHNDIGANRYRPIHAKSGSDYNEYSFNYIHDNGTIDTTYGGIFVIYAEGGAACSYNRIIGNTIKNENCVAGIHVGGGTTSVGNVIDGNTIYVSDDSVNGIVLNKGTDTNGATGTVISNNNIYSAGNHGILFQSGIFANTIIDGNRIWAAAKGVYLYVAQTAPTITNNDVYTSYGECVYIANSTARAVINSNNLCYHDTNFSIIRLKNTTYSSIQSNVLNYGKWSVDEASDGGNSNNVIANNVEVNINQSPTMTLQSKKVWGNSQYIAPGEIRTYSGTIATLTENAFNSVDNPFGQSVRVLSEDIYVSTGATATSPNIDCGIGSSATTDYTTLFDDLPGETVGFYNSLVTTPGAQTVPQLWASGSGNRYLNHSIKGAAATGMVATYTVTVMGV
jgi:hypothetical protein